MCGIAGLINLNNRSFDGESGSRFYFVDAGFDRHAASGFGLYDCGVKKAEIDKYEKYTGEFGGDLHDRATFECGICTTLLLSIC